MSLKPSTVRVIQAIMIAGYAALAAAALYFWPSLPRFILEVALEYPKAYLHGVLALFVVLAVGFVQIAAFAGFLKACSILASRFDDWLQRRHHRA